MRVVSPNSFQTCYAKLQGSWYSHLSLHSWKLQLTMFPWLNTWRYKPKRNSNSCKKNQIWNNITCSKTHELQFFKIKQCCTVLNSKQKIYIWSISQLLVIRRKIVLQTVSSQHCCVNTNSRQQNSHFIIISVYSWWHVSTSVLNDIQRTFQNGGV